jgi:hypothetical protein
MGKTRGFSDQTRGYLTLAERIIIVVNAFIISNALIGSTPVPLEAIWILALLSAVMPVIKEFGGVRDATTAAIAVKEDPNYKNFRQIPTKDLREV